MKRLNKKQISKLSGELELQSKYFVSKIENTLNGELQDIIKLLYPHKSLLTYGDVDVLTSFMLYCIGNLKFSNSDSHSLNYQLIKEQVQKFNNFQSMAKKKLKKVNPSTDEQKWEKWANSSAGISIREDIFSRFENVIKSESKKYNKKKK